jgi:RNA polymerase sigma factor (sigma-70 family)
MRGGAGTTSDGDVELLVRRAAGGDERAWGALVDRFGGVVRAVARAHRLSGSDAADVAQTTWLRLVEKLPLLDSPEHVGAWIATTARRECLRVLRAQRRVVPAGHEDFRAEEPDDRDVEAELLAGERERAVRDALRSLPERQRTLLRLIASEPAPTYDEISAVLGIPVGSIGPTRQRALARLRRELSQEQHRTPRSGIRSDRTDPQMERTDDEAVPHLVA